jgi:lipopolysaccharide export system permease protein
MKIIPSIPAYRTLDRYIIRKFLLTYLFGLLMMTIILVVFDYVERVDDFTELHAPWDAIIFDYYLNFIPYFINQFSALFTFISVIFFTSKLAMQTEIVAVLSGGVSFRRLMWPYMLGAGIIAISSLSLSLWIIPEGQKESVEFQSKYFKGNQLIDYDYNVYRQLDEGTFVYVRGYNPHTERVPFLAIETYDDSSMVEVLNAANATFDDESGRWTAPRYVIYSRTEDGSLGYEQFRNLDTLINLDARELIAPKGLVKTLRIDELNEFYHQQKAKGSDDLFLIEVERHVRYSYPFSTFILTLIGVSIASRKMRGGMGMHIGIGITLCFGYIMLGRIFEQVALGGTLPPWISVWLPNLIFAIIAIYVYRKAPK